MVLFRGESTPEWDKPEIVSRISTWYRIVEEWVNQVAGNNPERWQKVYNSTQKALIGDLIDAYDLKYFEGDAGSNLVKRQK
ncbi:MAG TPA: hypothetical protein VG917_04655 [Patescibacteria group bacterium]|nr:hypothetical protein [Patescibacteria group bacterium]